MKYQDLTKRGFSPRASSLIAFLIVGLLTAPRIRGQLLQGTINGNVTDSSQAAVVNAQVRAANQETNFSRETVTNNVGGYTLPNMPPGTYSVTVSSQGFQTQTLTGVAVTSGNITRRDVALGLGTVTETVTVGAQVASLQTDRADVRSEISTNAIASLPVPVGRNYQMLVTTLPGISPPQNANSFTANPGRTVQFSVNGNFTTVNNTRIDGTGAYNVTAPQAAMYGPALEAVETVSIVTNSFDAEQGTAGGGAVNVTVKSGTNALHGSLFEDHTDQHLKAYPWPADRTKPQSKYIFNQYGATLGGPIKKDKLFYFVSWEGTRFAAAPPIKLQVPTAAMKAGDLRASPTPIYDPRFGAANGAGRMPFPNNIIQPSEMDSGIRALLATGAWTDPNQKGTGAFGLGQNLLASASGGQHRDQIDSKVNWNPTSKLSMFVRFGFNNNGFFNPQPFGILGGPSLTSSNTAIGNGFGHIFSDTVSGTYVFTPHLLMDAYFGYSRNDNSSRPLNLDQNYGDSLLHIPGLSNAGLTGWAQQRQNGMPQFNIDGFANVGGIPSVFQPQDYSDAEHDYVANVNWLKGTHDLRGGFDWDRQGVNEWQAQGSGTGSNYITGAGGFHFTQGTTQLNGGPAGNDFNAFASFLLGLPANAGRVYVFPDEIRLHAQSLGLYLRDRWQVSPKLTLSYGVRWEYIPMPNRGSPRGPEYFDLQNNVEVICGLDNVPEDCGITRDKHRFIPRAGIAYRVSDSMVIRAGFGIANDPTTNLQGFRLDAPYVYSQLLNPPNSFSFATTLRQGLPVVIPPDLNHARVPWPGIANANTMNNSAWRRGYIETWNFTLEKRIKGWVGSAAYAGSRAVNAPDRIEQNWGPIGGGAAGQQLAKFGRVASNLLFGSLGTTKYDSLQLRLSHAYASGFQLNVSYTFSKVLGFANFTATNGAGGTPPVSIPAYYKKNYGPMQTNVPQNFQVTAVYELPWGKGRPWLNSGLGSKILGGWQLSALFSAYSGLPFSVAASATSLNAPFSSQFGDCLAPATYTGDILQLYKRSAFGVPSNGRFGTCGMNSLHGPRIVNGDAGLERTIAITERWHLKFRAEMFNVANTPHHATINATNANASVNASTFMQVIDIANTGREGIDERAARLSLKLTW